MLNYTDKKTTSNLSITEQIDILNDARTDIRGTSQILYAMAECDITIEPEQLKVIADVLAFAADAVSDVHYSIDTSRNVERSSMES